MKRGFSDYDAVEEWEADVAIIGAGAGGAATATALASESSCLRREATGPRVSSSKTPSGHSEICTKIEAHERLLATV